MGMKLLKLEREIKVMFYPTDIYIYIYIWTYEEEMIGDVRKLNRVVLVLNEALANLVKYL